ncbi:hypothetical protein ACJMK2_043729 [Sinanodonta woodiana]|uniref:ferroxidase n=1 Tax=Sinanodonta woodiana TaxID=1069815 RepID=A0ABD3VXU8_SINWO
MFSILRRSCSNKLYSRNFCRKGEYRIKTERNVSRVASLSSCLECCQQRVQCISTLQHSNYRFYSAVSQDSTELGEKQFEDLVEDTLDSLAVLFEDLPERFKCPPEYDISFGNGVLTVKISQTWGTYVINKQSPNKQIWLSSPLSGPKRYDFIRGKWIYKHDGRVLHDLLQDEISKALGQPVDFSKCSYSGDG